MSFSGSASQAQDQRCPCTLKLLRRLWWPNKESIRFESEPSFFCWFVDIFLLNCNMGNFECFFSFLNWKKLGHLGYFWWNMYTSWRLTVSQLFKEGNSVKIVGNHKWIHIIYIYTYIYTHIILYQCIYLYIHSTSMQQAFPLCFNVFLRMGRLHQTSTNYQDSKEATILANLTGKKERAWNCFGRILRVQDLVWQWRSSWPTSPYPKCFWDA